MCVRGGGYENGTYMYGGVPVCLCVMVPTPRLVCILCALSAVSMRLCIAYPIFLDSGLAVVCLLCSLGRYVGWENRVVQCMSYWAIVGCCCYCDELYYISLYVTKYTVLLHCHYVLKHLLL